VNYTNIRRTLDTISASIYANLKIYFRYKASLIVWLFSTPLWILFFTTMFTLFLPESHMRTMLHQLLLSFIFLNILSECMWATSSYLRGIKERNIMEYVMMTSGGLYISAYGSFARILTDNLIFSTYIVVVFKLMFDIDLTILNPIIFFVGLLLSYLISYGFGLILASLTYRYRTIGPIINIVQFPILILSGILLPVYSLPEEIQSISVFIPVTYPFDLSRYGAVKGSTILPLPLEFLVSILSTLLMNILGYLVLKYVEHRESIHPSSVM